MKRSRRGIDPVAWLVGLGLPALLLTGIFSTMPYARMAGVWPMMVNADEVRSFQRWFDMRDPNDDTARAERFELSGFADLTDGGWHRALFTVDGRGDSVSVRRLRTADDGLVIRFAKDRLFRGQRQIVLIPADVSSIRCKYEEVLADELGLLAPEVTFVDLGMPGGSAAYLKEERIDAGFLEKHRITDGALFTQGFAGRPDQAYPEVVQDTLAPRVIAAMERAMIANEPPWSFIAPGEAAGFLLMLAIADRTDLLLDECPFVHRWSSGRITPLYRARRDRSPEIAHRPREATLFRHMLRDAAFRDRLRDRQAQLEGTLWRLKERFAALDQAWLPVLAGSTGLPLARAEADRIKEQLLTRIHDLDVQAMFASSPPAPEPPPFADHGAGELPEPLSRQALADLLQGEWLGDSLVLRRGKRVITNDLILPVGVALVLEKSVRIELAPGRSVLVQGPLIARGTGVNPVFIRPLREDSAFGSFAVNTTGGRCDLRGLLVSGGSEARISGRYHSGMLSIHGATAAVLEHCTISGSRGEDALNIKGGTVLIRDCVFEDARADLVDLDFVKGGVSGCTFRNGGGNGDGLDVSGSRLHVAECSFAHLTDKGLSAGEVSEVLVTDCAFTANTLGIASKDLSIVHVDRCTFTDNRTVLAAYRKKPIYGGARLYLYGNTFIGNTTDREVDTLSAVMQKDALDERVRTAFGVVR